jgi:type VI secretion system secreted protein VgrG
MADAAPVEYSLLSAAFPDKPLTVSRALIEEQLSAPYFATVELSLWDPDGDASKLGGDDVVLVIKRGTVERRLCGVAVRVEETKLAKALPQVQLRIAPALELGRHRRNTRMFQEKTVPEILETVLGEMLGPYGRDVQLDLDETYEPREYCLQYQESDLDFVQRLMEEEGIAYSFDHAADVELLRLTDKNAAFEDVFTMAGDGVGHFEGTNLALTNEREPIHRFRVELEQTTTAIVVNDWDWTQSDMKIEQTADGEDAAGKIRESYEHGIGRSLAIGSYDEGAKKYQKNDGARQAPVRQEAARRTVKVGHGMGRLMGMQPGFKLTLEDHPNGDLNAEYLITRVSHVSAAAPLDTGGQAVGEAYHNTFECIPIETEYRPRRTVRKPRIDGVETAIVTGASGEEIDVDVHGRIKVQFHWDRENPADETSSCRIRVKQEWAGPSWGFWWVPRMGMEVIVHFVDGDPDRPLVTGCVYNSANTLPYALPDEKTKSTIKSNISLGGGGFNEFRFEDKAGSEEIYTHAQKDYNEVVENDHNTLVHHDQTNTVDNDQKQTIDVDQTERVDAKQTMTVGGNRTVHVKGNFDETVDGTEKRKVTGAVKETFAASETRTVSGSVTETLSANETRDVGANLDETIGGSHTRTVSGTEKLDVTGSQTRTATGGIATKTPATMTVDIAGSWTVTAAAGMKITAPAGITLTIPGGVGRADSFWDYVGGENKRLGVFAFELTVAKIDAAVNVVSVWGAKLDFCDSKKEAGPVTELSLKALRAKQFAALKKKYGAILTDTEIMAIFM